MTGSDWEGLGGENSSIIIYNSWALNLGHNMHHLHSQRVSDVTMDHAIFNKDSSWFVGKIKWALISFFFYFV